MFAESTARAASGGLDPLEPPIEIGRRDPTPVGDPSVGPREPRRLVVGVAAELEGAAVPGTLEFVRHALAQGTRGGRYYTCIPQRV